MVETLHQISLAPLRQTSNIPLGLLVSLAVGPLVDLQAILVMYLLKDIQNLVHPSNYYY